MSQGDISFAGYWVIVPFGGTLGAGTAQHWQQGDNPDIWFEVVPGTILRASISGQARVAKNPGGTTPEGDPFEAKDWEIHISIGDGPYWVEYDHVVDVLISDGEFVEAGQPLARAAPASIRHGGPEGEKPVDEFEWGLRRGGHTAIAICPLGFLKEEEQVKLQSVLETMRSLAFPTGDGVCLSQEVR